MTERPAAAGSRGLLLASVLPPAVLAVAVAAGLWGFSYDDAFITYRYAESWAAGGGLRFNPGEAVLGTSAPGWALILGLGARLGRAVGLDALGVPQWGTLLSVTALWWTSAALPALWLPRRRPYLPWMPLLFAALALTCRWNLELLGAETFAAAALAASAIWVGLAHRRRAATDELAGLLAGLAMVCRLDAALAAGLLAVALTWRRRRPAIRFVLAAAAIIGPCLLWVWSEAGTVLPNTLAGKRGEAGIAGVGYARAELAWLDRSLGGGVAVWVLAALALIGAFWLIRTLRGPGAGARLPVATLAGWLLLHEGFYHLAGVPFAPWYHVATLAALLGLATWGAVSLTAAVGAAISAAAAATATAAPTGAATAGSIIGSALGRTAAAAAALLLVPLWLPATEFLAGTWRQPPDVRTRLYAAVADRLRSTTPPNATVASMEIGALGFYSDRPVLDLVGLVDPAVVAARREGRLAELVAARAPEHILVPPPFLGRELGDVMRHPEIRRRYRPAARFFDPSYEHDPVTLFRRLDPARRSPDAP